MKAIDKVLTAIPGKHKQTKDGYMVSCPCDHHEDKNPSCEIKPNKNNDGFHIKCYSGCCSDNDLTAGLGRLLGVEWQNAMFFDRYWNEDTKTDTEEKTPHPTWQAARDAMRWSVEQQTKKKVVKTDSYLFAKADGTPVGYELHFRFADGTKEPRPIHTVNGEWFAGRGLQRWPLYNLPNLPLANGEAIFQHEGPKAAQAGIDAGLPSTCCMGGSNNPDFTDHAPLAGKNIGICLDNDKAGEKFGKRDTEILHDLETPAQVRLLRLNGRPEAGGDFADLYNECQDADEVQGLRQEVEDLFANTSPEVVQAKAKQPEQTGPTLRLTSMADIEAREVVWLWKNRITIGSLTLLTGPQGMTKSFLTVDLAARVSLGSPHPDGSGVCPQGRVIFFTMEDAPNEAIKPRLEACRANHAEVFYANGMVEKPEDESDHARMIRLNTELAELERAITQLGNVKLVIFDPLSEYLGKGDRNSDADVRGVLTPLSDMARRLGVAIVAVHHINKRSKDVSAVQTVGGAGAWTQVPRTVLHVINDPEDENISHTRRRLMVCTKSNYGGTNEGQTYRLTDGKHPAVEWLPEIIKIDAEQVVRSSRQQEDGRRKNQRREAAENDLYEIMQRGPVESNDIDHYMAEKGHSDRQIRAAKKGLGLVKLPRDRNTDPWKWTLPESQTGGLAEGQTGTCTIDEWLPA